jgi:hypothetical protein
VAAVDIRISPSMNGRSLTRLVSLEPPSFILWLETAESTKKVAWCQGPALLPALQEMSYTAARRCKPRFVISSWDHALSFWKGLTSSTLSLWESLTSSTLSPRGRGTG